MANTRLIECLGHWRIPSDRVKKLAQADVVLAHAFGDQTKLSRPTALIVGQAIVTADKYRKPLVCQFPGNKSASYRRGIRLEAVIEHHGLDQEFPLNIKEVNRQAAELCREHGWRTVILFAHPHHLWRAGKNLERHGITVVYPSMDEIPYDRSTSRLSFRSSLTFIPREIVMRLMYWCNGQL
ncbi:MAG: hypothetical protein KGJ34_02840 [Patescibacteria group bacterium]|nr:hypothetical protein [Patescibacteria group bacterium]